MLPFSVAPQGGFLRGVKHLDALEAGGLHVGVICVAKAMQPLVLEAVEPAFRQRIVPAISFAAH